MHPKALLFYLSFIGCWFGSFAVVPAAVGAWYFLGWRAPLIVFAFYVVLRLTWPMRVWPAFKRFMAFACANGDAGGYFTSYELVLDDGVTHEVGEGGWEGAEMCV